MRDEVQELLDVGPGTMQVFWVSEPDLAPARAQELMPQVILVDDDLGTMGMPVLVRELLLRVPNAGILALIREDGMDQARQAVLAGARGFVFKPLTAEELATTLSQILAVRPPRQEEEGERQAVGKVMVFCAPKGGTGRTTLAINTAISLQNESGQAVVLVDADYAAPAIDVALNLHTDRNVTDLLPRLDRLDEDLVRAVLTPHASGVEVLLAPPPSDLDNPISRSQVESILAILRRMFPWIIVDLGLPLDETAFAVLDSADRIIMSTLPEMVGLRNTRLMLDQFADRGYAEGKVWLVLNRATLQGGIGRRDIEERLRLRVSELIPDDQPLATSSINRGVPLVISHRRSAVGRAVRRFARHLIREKPGEQQAEAGSSTKKQPTKQPTKKGDRSMNALRISSYLLFLLGILAFLAFWLLGDSLLYGVVAGLIFVFGGLILFRRGS